ncbi:MAG: N-6 DNA Methylase [ANME-2 cluster archaeon HR1]|nr:MAG: N-6 DNA Methylase [ANME-2 cluster archaeon HR1]
MDKQTKTKIKNLVLELRDNFEKEIENRLNNIGIYPDKEWKDGRSLPHLSKDELDNRRRVAAFIKREEKIGHDQKKATSEFIKEASYTWINRLIGLKCMECRSLIEEVITTRPEYGGRSKQHRDFREKHPDLAAQPDDGLTGCLICAFEKVTKEIKVLFDPDNEYSLVIPRYPLLKTSIEKINSELDYDTYRQDEFLGWVYQYFNSREKDRVFEEVRTKKKKISGSDIINATQLYTEEYMVRFLVENSLGAMWMEMYPDSQLRERWEYFVKDPNNSTREPKPIKDITFLDPACGSGHFLLYAFDLYYDMYLEEGDIPEGRIPEYILRYNLHGIDIDLRAIQLSALGLYMKANSRNPDVVVQHMNLVSADAIMLDSDILGEFLQEFEDDPTALELIETIWQGLENVRELGSLLKVEEQIDEVIKRQRAKGTQKSLDDRDWREKGWEDWKGDLLTALKRYYEKAAQTFDLNRQMFANEACKGVQLLDLLERRYDVVATNPPYMGHGNMGEILKIAVKVFYPKSSKDLYAVFIERCLHLTKINGYTSMITQQSFMFITSYKELRKLILKNTILQKTIHLGPHAFEDISGEKVNTTMFSLLKNKLKNEKGIFFRLVSEVNKKKIIKYLIAHDEFINHKVFIIELSEFQDVEGCPFVYWMNESIREKIATLSSFRDIAEAKEGITTRANDYYLRYFWEIDPSKLGLDWIFYAKGGDYNKYYGNLELVINWKEHGKYIKKFPKSTIPNKKYIFKEGLTYTDISGKGFSVRYLPKNALFDSKGKGIFLKENDELLIYLLGLLNSKLVTCVLNMLNPTIDIKINDLNRIPVKVPDTSVLDKINLYTSKNCNIKRSYLQFTINDSEFKQTALQWVLEKKKK